MEHSEIEGCPWCGELPWFEGNGDNWQDDRRYVQMQLVCCARMSTGIGWDRAREMSPQEREDLMKKNLIAQWNSRYNERFGDDNANY